MSRILRRPMFRGGRVDGRGTGIASGLGYAGGGSVNTPKRGLVNEPGGYGGTLTDPQAIIDARKLGILMTPKHLDERFRKKYYLDDEVNYEGSGIPITGMQGMIEAEAGVDLEGNPIIQEGGMFDTTRDLILAGDKAGTPAEYEEFFKEKFITDNYKTEIKKQKEILEAAGDERLSQFNEGEVVSEEGETRAQFEERIRRENAEELQAIINAQLSKGTPEEEIEKNKKIFQKAYGSGRADDASSMLLNFAGKALKPEATVKSAFGEFFEDEGKRPSERKKYKDAATTAAINAYLTGQSSFQKFEDQLKLTQAGIDMKLKAGQPTNLDEALEFFRKTGDKLTSPGLMAKAVDKIYGKNTFAGPLIEDKTQLIIGKVYYADDPNNASNKVLFLIDENQEPQPIKTVYK
jgi:hypothetical protein